MVCSHSGKTNEGTHAPPSMTMMSVANMAMLRATSGDLPMAAMSSPNEALIMAKARMMAINPNQLPDTRTPNTPMATMSGELPTEKQRAQIVAAVSG